MAKKPVDSYNPAKMSEDAEYVYKECTTNINILAEKIETMPIEEMHDSLVAMSETIQKLKTAITLLCAKLDAEDVDNLDTDYTTTINPESL